MTEVGGREFNIEEFINRLGKEELQEGHISDIEERGDKLEDVLDREVRGRLNNLTGRVDVMSFQNKDKALIDDLKLRGTEAVLARFPEKKQDILTILRDHGGFDEIVESYEADKKKD